MFNQNCDLLTVYAYLKDHKADTLDSVVKVVEGFAARHGSAAHPQRRRQRRHRGRHQHRRQEGQRGDAGLVYLAVIVLAFITFRSWRAVICAVLPLMLTSVLCEALMVGSTSASRWPRCR
jgi:hypothetical protein